MAKSEKQLTRSETRFLADYLQLECQQMDRLIECAHRLKRTLTQQASPSASQAMVEDDETEVDLESFSPESIVAEDRLKVARKRLLQLLSSLSSQVDSSPSLVELIATAPQPHRRELMTYRVQLRQKLMELATINAGSQAVLVYTMDYYEKFLSGISGSDIKSQVYTPHGQMMPHFKSFTGKTV